LCIFNNTAIIARYLINHYGLSRIGILDFDVHHGNGTEQAFWTEPRVLFCSIHQENFFPSDTGDWYDVGEGDGKDFTINIPLPPKTQDKGYIETLDRLVTPRFEEFKRRSCWRRLVLTALAGSSRRFKPDRQSLRRDRQALASVAILPGKVASSPCLKAGTIPSATRRALRSSLRS
jgi:hypothetical protein